jgi:hypothetical protein
MVQILQSNEEGHELFPIKIRARMNEIWIDLEELEAIYDYYHKIMNEKSIQEQ